MAQPQSQDAAGCLGACLGTTGIIVWVIVSGFASMPLGLATALAIGDQYWVLFPFFALVIWGLFIALLILVARRVRRWWGP